MLAHFDRLPSTTALVLATGAFLTSATAQADPPHGTSKMQLAPAARSSRNQPRAPQVELEVRDSEPGHAAAIERVSVPLSDRAATKLDSWLRGSRYKVEIVRPDRDNPDSVSVELRREPRSESGAAEVSTSAVVRMKPNQRVVIARIERSNGSRTEVIATIR
jgi:hypothetical protein